MADAVIQVTGGVLRGAGDTRWLMVASVSLPLGYAGGAILHHQGIRTGSQSGLAGVCCADFCDRGGVRHPPARRAVAG